MDKNKRPRHRLQRCVSTASSSLEVTPDLSGANGQHSPERGCHEVTGVEKHADTNEKSSETFVSKLL